MKATSPHLKACFHVVSSNPYAEQYFDDHCARSWLGVQWAMPSRIHFVVFILGMYSLIRANVTQIIEDLSQPYVRFGKVSSNLVAPNKVEVRVGSWRAESG